MELGLPSTVEAAQAGPQGYAVCGACQHLVMLGVLDTMQAKAAAALEGSDSGSGDEGAGEGQAAGSTGPVETERAKRAKLQAKRPLTACLRLK